MAPKTKAASDLSSYLSPSLVPDPGGGLYAGMARGIWGRRGRGEVAEDDHWDHWEASLHVEAAPGVGKVCGSQTSFKPL